MNVNDLALTELAPRTLYAILQLRTDIFVVEQDCAYHELDGRDTEPDCRHIWIGDESTIMSYLRLLRDPGGVRIGRVATSRDHRGKAVATMLIRYVIDSYDGPFVLDAQSHLEQWYVGFGFERTGLAYVEDGIAHVPMRRPATI